MTLGLEIKGVVHDKGMTARMVRVRDACLSAGVSLPLEVRHYFARWEHVLCNEESLVQLPTCELHEHLYHFAAPAKCDHSIYINVMYLPKIVTGIVIRQERL